MAFTPEPLFNVLDHICILSPYVHVHALFSHQVCVWFTICASVLLDGSMDRLSSDAVPPAIAREWGESSDHKTRHQILGLDRCLFLGSTLFRFELNYPLISLYEYTRTGHPATHNLKPMMKTIRSILALALPSLVVQSVAQCPDYTGYSQASLCNP